MGDFCVCAEPIIERGLYPCGHALCLSCTLKKRTLMKDNQCPYCRTPAKQVAVVLDGSTDASEAKLDFQPGNLKVQDKSLVRKLRHILEYPCPECDEEQKNYKALKQHVHDVHGKALCDVCTKHEYNFSDEYQVFEPNKIKDHLKKKHISCKYCRIYFYSSTEFSKHCKEAHMGCGICERRDPEHPLYFKTYDQLYDHYKDKHYMCMVPSCLENKHIVFGTALELKKHMMEAHKGLLSNSRHNQQIDLDQVNLDAEEAQASTTRGPSKNELESERARYEARLEIAADHDQDKIERLRGASQTFIKKKVPVEVFIATFESVLSGTSPGGITALLLAFKRAHKADLSAEANRALGFKINLRNQAEKEVEEKAVAEKINQKNNSSSSSSLPKLRGPAPVAYPRINWGYNRSSAGIGDMTSLPKLGSGGSTTPEPATRSLGRQSSKSVPAWKPQASAPPTKALSNLPTLTKKKNPYEEPTPVRQTRIPLRDSRSSHSDYFRTLQTSGSPAGSRDISRAASPSPSLSPSPSGTSSNSSTASVASQAQQPSPKKQQQGLQLSSLPSLPQKQKPSEKKRQRNVVRIV